jgi:general secretion pathway protein F
MASFRFEAADQAGKIDRGVVEADSARAARAQLRTRGLTPLQVEAVAAQDAAGTRSIGRLGTRLSDNELALLTRQFASLLGARLPLASALAALAEQAERPYQREVLSSLRSDVLSGHTLADALKARPRDFPEVYRALVAAGEESGDLALVMMRLADYIEERNNLRNKVMAAFTYPVIVACVAMAIVIFLLTYVVPEVVSVFTQTNRSLPLLTQLMLGLSAFVRSWGWLVAVAVAGAWFAWRRALRQDDFRGAWHARILRLPLAGRFALGMNTARFASTLAILVGAGVPLLRALEAARQTMTNDVLKSAVAESVTRVREGTSLARALGAQKLFPPVLVHMIASGEQTGEVADMLERAAVQQAREVERRAMILTSLLEPALILAMAGMVLMIVLAVLMPIIEINQLVR